jgi:hypothetical protein
MRRYLVFIILVSCTQNDSQEIVPVERMLPSQIQFTDLPCDGVPQVNAQGEHNGYITCHDQRILRLGAARCSPPERSIHHTCEASSYRSGSSNCRSDASCNEQINGVCQERTYYVGVDGDAIDCSCVYYCQIDSDCADGQLCLCQGDRPGVCVFSNCDSSADCGTDQCELSSYQDCGLHQAIACHSSDACQSDEECDSSICGTQGSGWRCLEREECG